MKIPNKGDLVELLQEYNTHTLSYERLPVGTILQIVDYKFEQVGGDAVDMYLILAYEDGNNPRRKTKAGVDFICINWTIHQHSMRLIPNGPAAEILYKNS